ncbi:MAG: hypothetical protein ABI415_04410 [Flavitalea sp.]
MRFLLPLFLLAFVCLHISCYSQDSSQTSPISISPRYVDKVSRKADDINGRIDKTTEKVLHRFQKQQEKIKRKLYAIDSLAAKNIFTTSEQQFKELQLKISQPQRLTHYIPFLDSLKTSLKFLEKNKAALANVEGLKDKMQGSVNKVDELENQLQKAEEVKMFLQQQKQFLKEELGKFGFAKQLKQLNKDVYYYGQQVNEYKKTLKDPKKIERKALDLLSRTKLFQDFMKKNSMLASLFGTPADNPGNSAYVQGVPGLQTRAQVNQIIQTQITGSGPGAPQQLQNSLQQAQGELTQLKDKIIKAVANGGNIEGGDLPEFNPNNQKTKKFLNRLEWGTNIQSTRGNNFFPGVSDIGLSIGYALNDKSILGIGGSYKLGWGQNIQHIRITHQGASIRSFIDYKLKKSFWLSGGYEMNYSEEIKKIEQLKNMSAWQQSGLLGFSKKMSINTKFFKNTKIQLLWDFLGYRQVPRRQAIVFRAGYSF